MQTEETVKRPSRKKWIILLITLSLIFFSSSAISLREYYFDRNINITVSDNIDELKVTARFPREKTRALHKYLRSQLNLSELSDPNNLVINKYQAPDDKMAVYLESKPGYIKIVLDKNRNSKEAYRKLKDASEGIKYIFTRTDYNQASFEPLFYSLIFFLPLV